VQELSILTSILVDSCRRDLATRYPRSATCDSQSPDLGSDTLHAVVTSLRDGLKGATVAEAAVIKEEAEDQQREIGVRLMPAVTRQLGDIPRGSGDERNTLLRLANDVALSTSACGMFAFLKRESERWSY
jgi:hypothetical protein